MDNRQRPRGAFTAPATFSGRTHSCAAATCSRRAAHRGAPNRRAPYPERAQSKGSAVMDEVPRRRAIGGGGSRVLGGWDQVGSAGEVGARGWPRNAPTRARKTRPPSPKKARGRVGRGECRGLEPATSRDRLDSPGRRTEACVRSGDARLSRNDRLCRRVEDGERRAVLLRRLRAGRTARASPSAPTAVQPTQGFWGRSRDTEGVGALAGL